jgi:hypothetical protein
VNFWSAESVEELIATPSRISDFEISNVFFSEKAMFCTWVNVFGLRRIARRAQVPKIKLKERNHEK